MGGFNFRFSLRWQYGDKKGSFDLVNRHLREGISNWRPAFEMIAADVLEPYVMRAFGTEGGSVIGGAGWAQLAPATVARRGSAHPILQVTGKLKESFQAGGANHVSEIGDLRLSWGSESPLSIFHEFGTRGRVSFKAAGARAVVHKTEESRARSARGIDEGKGRGIPPRPMLRYSRELANEITSKMVAHAALVARQAGYTVGHRAFGHESLEPGEARQLGEESLINAGSPLSSGT